MVSYEFYLFFLQMVNVSVPFVFKELIDWLNVGGFDTPQQTLMTFGTALVVGCK